MAPKSFFLDDELFDYVVAHTTALDDDQRAAIDETAALGEISRMQLAPDQGMLLTILTAAIGAERAVEVGTFTGFSAMCIARGLRPGGRLLCCDVSEEWTAIARQRWEAAGVADRIDLKLAPAIETLRALPADAHLDLAFVDADKPGYVDYYEELVPRLRPGGLLLADNVLWGGRITHDDPNDEGGSALRRFNDRVASDDRVRAVLLTVGDGLMLAVKN